MTIQLPPSTSSDSLRKHPYVIAIQKPIRRPRATPMYLLHSAIVATAMILLPLIYLSLIAAVGFGTFWYIAHLSGILEVARASSYAILILFLPILAGFILLLFMIKPIFARHKILYAPQALTRADEPLLFAYVDALCQTLGAPKPNAIHINMNLNASAGFEGAFAGIFGRKLTLTFGLPLIAGMPLHHFTSVLVHEFGHFRQRGGTRLSYTIRSINYWFARIVYERDQWDVQLVETARSGGHWTVQLLALLSLYMIQFSRRILWLLMMTGNLCSAAFLRQKEFDADRQAASVVGPLAAQQALRSLPVLESVMKDTYAELRQTLAEKRLPDDIPQLIASRTRAIPQKIQNALWQKATEKNVGWFDSHPSLPDRVASIAKLPPSTTFNIDTPAHTLLANYKSLSQLMTLNFYHSTLQRHPHKVTLVAADTIESRREEQKQKAESLTHYLADLVDPLRPIFLPDDALEGTDVQLAAKLLALRSAFNQALPDALAVVDAWKHADDELIAIEESTAVVNAGVPSAKGIDISVADPNILALRRREIQNNRTQACAIIDAALTPAMLALRIALHLGKPPPPPPSQEISYELAQDVAAGPLDPHAAALLILRSTTSHIAELRRLSHQLHALGKLAHLHGRDRNFLGAAVALSRKQTTILEQLRSAYKDTRYPYAPAERPLNLASYLLQMPTHFQHLNKTLQASNHALAQIDALYLRLMADLATYAQQMEQKLSADSPLT